MEHEEIRAFSTLYKSIRWRMKLEWSMKNEEGGSRPVSRVLSWTTIHLGCASPHTSSNLPGNCAGHTLAARRPRAPLFGLAPGGVYRAADCCQPRGALLPHLFTLAGARRRLGGMFSVALSVGSRRPGVTWHPALRSPDFPPRLAAPRSSGRLPKHSVKLQVTSCKLFLPLLATCHLPLVTAFP